MVLVLGRRGTGKTTLARRLSEAWPGRVYAHDPLAVLPPEWPEVSEAVLDQPGSLVVLDEVDLLCSPAGYAEGWLRQLVHYGRHYGVSVIGTSRRPANIHRDLTALASEVYLGRITEPRDLDYCVRAWGEICRGARDLPPYKFLHIFP